LNTDLFTEDVMKRALLGMVAASAVVGGIIATNTADAHNRSAEASLMTADGTPIGSVRFRTERHHTDVRVRLTGAPGLDAFHGFHIHANDVATNGDGCVADPNASPGTWFVSADGHYNPTAQPHSHHAGDLPSVYVSGDGTVETRFHMDRITPNELNGRVVILHAGADNFANIPLGPGPAQYTANSDEATAATARTGNAGDRVACGEIRSR
jgi:superoxide dismutase, Cu-Zn family